MSFWFKISSSTQKEVNHFICGKKHERNGSHLIELFDVKFASVDAGLVDARPVGGYVGRKQAHPVLHCDWRLVILDRGQNCV